MVGPALRGTKTTPKMMIFQGCPPKKCCTVVPGPFWPSLFSMFPQWPPGAAPGPFRAPPRRVKSINFPLQRPPQAAKNRPRASPRGFRGGSGSRVGARGPPRALQGGILEPFWLHFAPPGGHFSCFFETCVGVILRVFWNKFLNILCAILGSPDQSPNKTKACHNKLPAKRPT